MRIAMFQAGEGDSFLIEAGERSAVCILVDTGTVSAWDTNIAKAISKTVSNGKKIDLLIVTHIDNDHIGGAVKLLKGTSKVDIGQIWFNGLSQLYNLIKHPTSLSASLVLPLQYAGSSDDFSGTRDISFQKSAELSYCLSKMKIPINEAFDGKAVMGPLYRIALSPEVSISILLPTQEKLKSLLIAFERELRGYKSTNKLDDSPSLQAAFEIFCRNQVSQITETHGISSNGGFDIENLAKPKDVSPDSSITNASSIAFILEYGDRKLLFLGDTVESVAIPALKEWGRVTGNPLFFDVVKLPHHGAKGNCIKLLDAIDGRYFLISTNGERHGHPSAETVAKIVARRTNSERTIVFNYQHSIANKFNSPELREKYLYKVSFDREIEL